MKKNIALVTGGYSGEAVVAYKSATTINNNLDKNRYAVYKIDLTKDGWFYKAEDGSRTPVDKNNFTIQSEGETITFDAVLIAIHGTPGEDGKLQGYFDMLNLPYTGCNASTSAITFNKSYTTGVAGKGGIHVANSVLMFKHSPLNAAQVLEKLSLPLFVKPNNGGSSIGMSKVIKEEELQPAIDKAFKEDDQALVEEMISGREFTIGVYKSQGKIITLPMTEVIADASKAFFDFEAKYEGKSTEITPAQVDENIAEKIRAAAKKIYALFNCRGVIRIDFIYNESKAEPFMLEVNTIPGQSAASIVPQQVAAAGGNLKDFYTLLVEECFV
ncbi:MAG TPA: D-alanine--D-alanine ligase [Niabella sp.]|nr:D-alanine--D-alanine ligase [Niabella sp.]HOZ97829.1 D-alanine--D-alanine ligase [Niabella sp.]HQW15668.1 D-alanine--D-alanine ligase [Niabella sp.]HQX20815.1 D-alanine--D-alanine ligase [Niabella sp.]HQX41400.1 D-alanine--D-alanine ligase [Niabella sp.]